MIENTDTLLAMAEIAAAFAGFAALVSAIRRTTHRPADALHDLLRLRLVIASSVAGVAAALIPVGLDGYGGPAAWTWRVAAALFLVFDNGILASFVSAYRPVRGTFEPDRVAVAVVSALEIVEQGSLATILLGVPVAEPSALYLTALIANLCQVGFIFVRFVGSTFRPGDDLVGG